MNKNPKLSFKLRTFYLAYVFCALAGCQASYMDPYEGKADNDRNFKQEGLISTMFSYLVVGDLKDESKDPAQTPPRYRESPACAPDHMVDWAMLDQLYWQMRQQIPEKQLVLKRIDTTIVGQFAMNQYQTPEQEHIDANQYVLWDRLTSILMPYERIKIEVIGRSPVAGFAGEPLAQARAEHMLRYLNKSGLAAYRTRSTGVATQGNANENSQRLTFLLCTI
jgi:hypothetical protein